MGTLRYGVHRPLEDEADRIIAQGLKGVTRHSDKSDILTPWKADDRKKREVYTSNGVPDRSVRQGMFHRAWNRDRPHLNSRDGLARHSGQGVPHDVVDLNKMPSPTYGRGTFGGSLAGFVAAQFDEPESYE